MDPSMSIMGSADAKVGDDEGGSGWLVEPDGAVPYSPDPITGDTSFHPRSRPSNPQGEGSSKITCYGRRTQSEKPSKSGTRSKRCYVDVDSSDGVRITDPVPPRKRHKDVVDDDDDSYELYLDRIRTKRTEAFSEVIESLTPLQKEDVKAIGFGGLLTFSCTALLSTMNQWLIDCFDPVTKYFSCDGHIRFSLTSMDAKRVFGLPLNPDKPVDVVGYNPEVRGLIQRWKDVYCLRPRDYISIEKLKCMISRLRQGGADFKRFFVLFAMKMVLAPDAGSSIHLGLLNALWDVDSIKNYHWAGYVVDDLCLKINNHVGSDLNSRMGCEGCLLLLQITYFHSTIWPEAPLSFDEPYIQHWGGHRIGTRVLQESRAKGYGKLLFKDVNHGFTRMASARCSEIPSFSDSEAEHGDPDCWRLSEEELGESILEENKRKTWHVFRHVDQVLSKYADSLDMSIQQLNACCFRKCRDGAMKIDVRFGYDIVVSNLFKVCSRLSPEMGTIEPSLYAESNPIIEPIDEDFPMLEMMYTPWKTWTFHYPPTFTSELLQRVCTLSHNFQQHNMEVVDFCLAGGLASQILYDNGGSMVLSRADMWTLEPYMSVSSAVVNVYAMILNQFWNKHRWTTRVCLESVLIEKEGFDPKVVVDRWLEWLSGCDLDIEDADFVHIPVLFDEAWSLVVINFTEDKVQCIAPKRTNNGNDGYEKRGRLIGTSFWMLLEVLKYKDKLVRYREFSYEAMVPRWSEGQRYTDQGICVMRMMESFTGSRFTLDGMRLLEEKKKMQLRVSYVCFIAMDDTNTRRQSLLEGCGRFLAAKGVAAGR